KSSRDNGLGPIRSADHTRTAESAAAIRAKSSTDSCSPRVLGATPAASNTCSARAALPAQDASPARSVLRRWANAASISAKVCSRPAGVTGDSRRRISTSAESTLGTGQNTVLGTVATRLALAYQAIFTLGTP